MELWCIPELSAAYQKQRWNEGVLGDAVGGGMMLWVLVTLSKTAEFRGVWNLWAGLPLQAGESRQLGKRTGKDCMGVHRGWWQMHNFGMCWLHSYQDGWNREGKWQWPGVLESSSSRDTMVQDGSAFPLCLVHHSMHKIRSSGARRTANCSSLVMF